jgi:hypothetical protein
MADRLVTINTIIPLLQIFDVARGIYHMHQGASVFGHVGVVHGFIKIRDILIKDSGRAVLSGIVRSQVCIC